ncbi:14641_t:CDS:2, partial [Acaulospora colombiana]
MIADGTNINKLWNTLRKWILEAAHSHIKQYKKKKRKRYKPAIEIKLILLLQLNELRTQLNLLRKHSPRFSHTRTGTLYNNISDHIPINPLDDNTNLQLAIEEIDQWIKPFSVNPNGVSSLQDWSWEKTQTNKSSLTLNPSSKLLEHTLKTRPNTE